MDIVGRIGHRWGVMRLIALFIAFLFGLIGSTVWFNTHSMHAMVEIGLLLVVTVCVLVLFGLLYRLMTRSIRVQLLAQYH